MVYHRSMPPRDTHSPHVVRIEDPDDPRLEEYRSIQDRDVKGPDGRPVWDRV